MTAKQQTGACPSHERAIDDINLVLHVGERKGTPPVVEHFADRSLCQLTRIVGGGPATNHGPVTDGLYGKPADATARAVCKPSGKTLIEVWRRRSRGLRFIRQRRGLVLQIGLSSRLAFTVAMDAIQNFTAVDFDVGGSFDPNTNLAFCQANDIDGYAVSATSDISSRK